MSTGITLSAYLAAESLTDAEFAALVESDRTTISRVRRGLYAGSGDLQRRIYSATNGRVTPNDLTGLYPVEATPSGSLPAVHSSVQ